MKTKRTLATVVAFTIVFGSTPMQPVVDVIGNLSITANAEDDVITGSCGDNANYEFNQTTGKLTISGTGAIAESAFDYYANDWVENIKSVVIEDGITEISSRAFYWCTNLESITIPDSVTSIGGQAFFNCSGLTNITIPNSVTSIGFGAFFGCSSLVSIIIPDSVTSIGNSAFKATPWLETKQEENPLVVVNGILIDGTTCEGDITIPVSVTSIGESAFYYCENLTSITIPDSVTSIGDWVFDSCSSLESITIPDSVTSIGDGTFYECTGLTSIKIPDSVTSIGDGAFYGCTSLTDITIKNSNCDIYDDEETISDTATIYGYKGSTAEKYATKYDRTFVALEKESTVTLGDLSGDGVIDSDDAVLTLKIANAIMMGEATLTDEEMAIADVNHDGNIDSDDCVLIMKYANAEMLGEELPF